MTLLACFFWNWSACQLCRSAVCASHFQLSFVDLRILGWPSLVLDGFPSSSFLRWLLTIFHCFLSFACAGHGGGRILRLFVGISRLVVFSLSASFQVSANNLFHPFSTVCLWNESESSLYFHWQTACWADGGRESQFVRFFSSSGD